MADYRKTGIKKKGVDFGGLEDDDSPVKEMPSRLLDETEKVYNPKKWKNLLEQKIMQQTDHRQKREEEFSSANLFALKFNEKLYGPPSYSWKDNAEYYG